MKNYLFALSIISTASTGFAQELAKAVPGEGACVSSKLIYELDGRQTPECHASTIVETADGLVAAWFGGTKENDADVGIWSSYHDGKTWSRPKEWANGIQHQGLRFPTWNPVLFQANKNAPLMLFFKCGPNPREWWGELIVSRDNGRTFGERRRLPEQIHGPVRSKPLLLEDGTVLCGCSTEIDNDWRIHFERLTDLTDPAAGPSWQRVENKEQKFQVIQPTFLRHTDGRIQALCRSKHKRIVQTFSTDNGKTWSPLELTEMPNNNSGIEALTLKDGRHLLLYNHVSGDRKDGWGRRNILNLAISSDGKDWQPVAVVDKADRGEFSYPAMIQTRDGLLHMTYTWNRKSVRHAVFDPGKLGR